MRIAILGDVHGCVRHASAVITALGADAAIQVGDLGAHPSYQALPPSDLTFVDAHPEQGDIFELLTGQARLPVTVPTYFVTGNHDSPDWLASLHAADQAAAPIDPQRVFLHVACGSTLELGGRRVRFLGGIEEPEAGHDIDLIAAQQLENIDVLVTHDGPYGLASWRGKTQGSPKLFRLIEQLQPHCTSMVTTTIATALATTAGPGRSAWRSLFHQAFGLTSWRWRAAASACSTPTL